VNALRKRRPKKVPINKQRDIFGTRIKRIKNCVFCEIGIDLDEDIFVADGRGDLLHMNCFNERLEAFNEGKSLQRHKEDKGAD